MRDNRTSGCHCCIHEAPAASTGPEPSIETAGSGYKRQRIGLAFIALKLVAIETVLSQMAKRRHDGAS